jgi:hypothetical protein
MHRVVRQTSPYEVIVDYDIDGQIVRLPVKLSKYMLDMGLRSAEQEAWLALLAGESKAKRIAKLGKQKD